MNRNLKILEHAITDIGHWRWWTNQDTIYQLEFGMVKLLLPSTQNNLPPNYTLALQFRNVEHLELLEWNRENSSIPADWFKLLHEDKIEPFNLTEGDFTLTEKETLIKLYNTAPIRKLIVGEKGDIKPKLKNSSFLCFRSTQVGLLLVGKKMRIISRNGEILEDEVEELHNKWWSYWREYWEKKDTELELPRDLMCEINIPIKK